MDILKAALEYLERHDIDMTPEELFIQFEQIIKLHSEFEQYLKDNNLNQSLEKMKRNERLLEKRKLFYNWFICKNQNTSSIKKTLINLSEITFVTSKTVQNILKE